MTKGLNDIAEALAQMDLSLEDMRGLVSPDFHKEASFPTRFGDKAFRGLTKRELATLVFTGILMNARLTSKFAGSSDMEEGDKDRLVDSWVDRFLRLANAPTVREHAEALVVNAEDKIEAQEPEPEQKLDSTELTYQEWLKERGGKSE